MNDTERKQSIAVALRQFDAVSLYDASIGLFAALGYQSDRRLPLKAGTPENFLRTFVQDRSLNQAAALFADWREAEFLFQITTDEVQAASEGSFAFTGRRQFEPLDYDSYLFVAVKLCYDYYSRTQIAGLTREINRLFPQPVMLLLRHGAFISLSIIHRRPGRREPVRDVLEKVTLIKDVRWSDPIRAHVDILAEFRLDQLQKDFPFQDFAGLHKAWECRLATYQVNEEFYKNVANWYFWALRHEGVVYPPDIQNLNPESEEGRELRSIFLIRVLTRLIFCWFLKEKGIVPPELFRRHEAVRLLGTVEPKDDNYYRTILQNVFFATLNVPRDERKFIRKDTYQGKSPDYTNQYVFRYREEFADLDAFLSLIENIPFLNGGLFECLDKKPTEESPGKERRLDGFSRTRSKQTRLPNQLFFEDDPNYFTDLTEFYQDKKGAPKWAKAVSVSGILTILGRYKFTVVENTPFEEEIALDPELLGKVFENLLASYNEDTRTTARKATGSFYTPREIVSYMVDGALHSYFEACLGLKELTGKPEAESMAPLRDKLRDLFAKDPASYRVEDHFLESDIVTLIGAVDRLKLLDPACGSGAFPMGALHRLVNLLAKLDPNNRRWKEQQLARAQADREIAEQMQDEKNRENALRDIENRLVDIERSFNQQFHELDYARKLYLIENGVFGVDIQPIATQIAKLRFFIALIVDQKTDAGDSNLGIRPLPNLETKIVAADFTVPVEQKLTQGGLFEDNTAQLRRLIAMKDELARVRHDHFNARNPSKKEQCRKRDNQLRHEMAELLEKTGMKAAQAAQLADWDPYDQNSHARFFDADWMFNFTRERERERIAATIRGEVGFVNQAQRQQEILSGSSKARTDISGFDIIIGNPPYIRIQTLKQKDPELVEFYKKEYVSATKGNYDLYVVFVEAGLRLLQPTGNLAYILPHKFFNAQYGEPLRGHLAQGKHLREILHFGDQQVFPGATNYVCLLFLEKTIQERFKFARANDLADWLKTHNAIERRFTTKSVSVEEWNFAVGKSASAMDQLAGTRFKLRDVAARIFQGLVTGADPVFILKPTGHGRFHSECTGTDHEIEEDLMHPLCKGAVDIRRYYVERLTKSILFPYQLESGSAVLISWVCSRICG